MPRLTVFADVDQVVTRDDEQVSVPAGEGVEFGEAGRGRVRKPTILKPPVLKPTARVHRSPGEPVPRIPREQLDEVPGDEPVVAEVDAGGEVSLDELEPLRDQVHSTGRDLIVVLTDSGG
jgi:hypothetical protein